MAVMMANNNRGLSISGLLLAISFLFWADMSAFSPILILFSNDHNLILTSDIVI